jgi:hypothetical protein
MRATDVKKVISMKVSGILVLIQKGFSSENNFMNEQYMMLERNLRSERMG